MSTWQHAVSQSEKHKEMVYWVWEMMRTWQKSSRENTPMTVSQTPSPNIGNVSDLTDGLWLKGEPKSTVMFQHLKESSHRWAKAQLSYIVHDFEM